MPSDNKFQGLSDRFPADEPGSAMTTRQDVKEASTDTFPYTGLRLLAAMQVNIGVFIFILGMVDLILTYTLHVRDLHNYEPRYGVVVSLTLVSAPLWCGMWYSVTGALGVCLTRDRVSTMLYCRISFLVLNLMCCAVFGPVCAVISGLISYTRHVLTKADYQWLISLIICFLAILQIMMATVSAFVTCCCSTPRPAQVNIYVSPSNKYRPERKPREDNKPDIIRLSSCDDSTTNNNTTSTSYGRTNTTSSRPLHVSTPPQHGDRPTGDKNVSRTPDMDVFQTTDRNVYRTLERDISLNVFSQQLMPQGTDNVTEAQVVSPGYSALKKWALPHR